MTSLLAEASSHYLVIFNRWLESHINELSLRANSIPLMNESQSYSLLTGGKRFRPFLTYLISKLWMLDIESIKNYCLALEMVHTYSLIHDDLPCMDNDDYRRGQLTSHKKFGEDIALLAGDALLTEAFYLISHQKNLKADIKIKLIQILSEKIGATGMVGGQVLDMKSDFQKEFQILSESKAQNPPTSTLQNTEDSLHILEKIHTLKTGYLIQAAAVGGAILAEASNEELQFISDFALNLGLAFQIKDDLLDANDPEQDFKSYLFLLGFEQTQHELQKKSDLAENSIRKLQNFASIQQPTLQLLVDLIRYNQNRVS